MSNLPRFEPLPLPTVDTPTGQRIDHDNLPVCNVCSARGPLDRTTSCCRDCYRFEFFMLRLLVALGHEVGEPPEKLAK